MGESVREEEDVLIRIEEIVIEIEDATAGLALANCEIGQRHDEQRRCVIRHADRD